MIEDILTQYFINGCEVNRRFISKKNNVYLIKTLGQENIYYVLKEYNNVNKIDTERELLKKLKAQNICVPDLYFSGTGCIIMEYIEGELLLDVLFDNDPDKGKNGLRGKTQRVLYELAIWLRGFYSVAKNPIGQQLILGDVNFRNFIFNGKIYGIDFEDCIEGTVEQDVGRILAFSLSYIPAFTEWKISITREIFYTLWKELKFNRDLAIREAHKELGAIGTRRRIYIPPGILEKVYI